MLLNGGQAGESIGEKTDFWRTAKGALQRSLKKVFDLLIIDN